MRITITISTEDRILHKITTTLDQAQKTEVCIQLPQENVPSELSAFIDMQLRPALEAEGCRVLESGETPSHGYIIQISYAYGPQPKDSLQGNVKLLLCLNDEFSDGYPRQSVCPCHLPADAEVISYNGLEDLPGLTEAIINTLRKWQR